LGKSKSTDTEEEEGEEEDEDGEWQEGIWELEICKVFSFPVQAAGPVSLLQCKASLEKCIKCTLKGREDSPILQPVFLLL
jgi:hypothetical protein